MFGQFNISQERCQELEEINQQLMVQHPSLIKYRRMLFYCEFDKIMIIEFTIILFQIFQDSTSMWSEMVSDREKQFVITKLEKKTL